MQVHTERGLINVEAEYQSEEKAKMDGYSYAFYSKELEKKVYSKCLDDRGLYHTFALIVGYNQNNYSIQESEVEQMSKIPMYEIRSKKNRGHVFMFQNEDGTQKPAKYLFKDSAEKMLAILNKDCNQYYIVLA